MTTLMASSAAGQPSRSAFILIAVMMAASGLILASPAVIAQPVAAVSCSVDVPAAPSKISGPAVRGTGRTTCTTSVSSVEVRITIHAKDCGACSYYFFAVGPFEGLVNSSTSGLQNHSGYCSGTRYYRVHVQGSYKANVGDSWSYTGTKMTNWYTLPC